MLLMMGLAVPSTEAQDTYLGVLEDVPSATGGSSFRSVRVVFRKDGTDWRALPDCPDSDCMRREYPHQVAWTIAFDGRELGHVTGRTREDFSYLYQVGLQEIVSTGPIPTVGKRSRDYAGWMGDALFRPLVANSQPYVGDPESWKPSQPSAEHVRLLRQEFHRKFPKLCRVSKQDETKLEPLPSRDENIRVVKAYASNRGWAVARLHLAGAISCEDLEAGFEMGDPWFTINPEHSVQYLGQDIWLLDAGDYDNDGRSEVVFVIEGYNRGGYELFYDDFRKHAIFEYSYH